MLRYAGVVRICLTESQSLEIPNPSKISVSPSESRSHCLSQGWEQRVLPSAAYHTFQLHYQSGWGCGPVDVMANGGWNHGFPTSMARNRPNERAGAEWSNVGEAHRTLQRLIGWSSSGRQERKQLAQALGYPRVPLLSSFSVSGFSVSIHSIHCARVASARHGSFCTRCRSGVCPFRGEKRGRDTQPTEYTAFRQSFGMLYLSLFKKNYHQTTIITLLVIFPELKPATAGCQQVCGESKGDFKWAKGREEKGQS